MTPPSMSDYGDGGNFGDSEVVLMVRTAWESLWKGGHLECLILLRGGGGGSQGGNPTKLQDQQFAEINPR